MRRVLAVIAAFAALPASAEAFKVRPEYSRGDFVWFGHRCGDRTSDPSFLPKGTYKAQLLGLHLGDGISIEGEKRPAATVTHIRFARDHRGRGPAVVVRLHWDGILCSDPDGHPPRSRDRRGYEINLGTPRIRYRRRLSGERYRATVAAPGIGARRSFTVGDRVALWFRDRAKYRTRYRVCLSGATTGCWTRRTRRSGRRSSVRTTAAAAGTTTVRWYVKDRLVEKDRFEAAPPG